MMDGVWSEKDAEICGLREKIQQLECELQEKTDENNSLKARVQELINQCNTLYDKHNCKNIAGMNIPNKVRIGSMDYEVVLTDEPLVMDGKECYGTVDYNFPVIKISDKLQDKQRQEQTFLHELVHVV